MTDTTFKFRDALLKLCRREDLSRDEARQAFLHMMSGNAREAEIAALLVGLAAKGTTVEELVGAATVMREKVLGIDCAAEVVLDTCGTGGTVRGTFNISTAAALVTAGAGLHVVKHGNRSASSKTGSADALEALGVKLEVSPERLQQSLDEAGICFAFARSHHPAMKHVAPTRTALGIPTIFNILGPLTNPAGARHQLLGVFAAELTDRLAAVLRELGTQRAWVVHAEDGMDELSNLGPTRVSELRDGHINTWRLDPREHDISYGRLGDLQVNSPAESATVIRDILAGQGGGPRDIVTLNAAGALVIGGHADTLSEGIKQARASIDSGRAQKTLETLVRVSNQ